MRKATKIAGTPDGTKTPYTTTPIARAWRCSEGLVRYYVKIGRLTPIATTPTGINLFDPADVERIRLEREARG